MVDIDKVLLDHVLAACHAAFNPHVMTQVHTST